MLSTGHFFPVLPYLLAVFLNIGCETALFPEIIPGHRLKALNMGLANVFVGERDVLAVERLTPNLVAFGEIEFTGVRKLITVMHYDITDLIPFILRAPILDDKAR